MPAQASEQCEEEVTVFLSVSIGLYIVTVSRQCRYIKAQHEKKNSIFQNTGAPGRLVI